MLKHILGFRKQFSFSLSYKKNLVHEQDLSPETYLKQYKDLKGVIFRDKYFFLGITKSCEKV